MDELRLRTYKLLLGVKVAWKYFAYVKLLDEKSLDDGKKLLSH